MQSGTVHKIILSGALLALLPFLPVGAQITSATANRIDSLPYPDSPGKDPLFVFYQTGGVTGSLDATLPGGAVSSFEWSRYNHTAGGFDPPFSADDNVASSNIAGLENGGYRVRIFNSSGTDTSMLAWVLVDQFTARVSKTSEGKLNEHLYTCDRLALIGMVAPDTLTYYDPLSHQVIERALDFKFKWTSDNDQLRIPNDTLVLAPNITYAPPYKDTWYILTASDEMGMAGVDSVFYESIQTRAGFTVEYLDKVTGEWDESLTGSWSKDKGSLDARLTVRFRNESENGATFLWVFLDTLGGIRQEATTNDLEEMPEYTYEKADEYYYPYMYSTSEAGCIDSARLDEGIFVEPSQLSIPNVFSPNGDGINDRFLFKHQSLQSCTVTIVDRTGKVVYKASIDDIYAWEGWDGNLNESDRRAPEGQYYFVVEAFGYDGIEYTDPSIWSTMKLFGGEGNQDSGSGTGGSGTGEEAASLYTGWLYLYR